MAETDLAASSSRAARFVVPYVLLALASLFGFWFGWTRIARTANNQGLIIPDEALDVGELWVQDGFEWLLPLHNTTQEELKVVAVDVSCSCALVEPQALIIRAGGTAQKRMTLDLTGVKSYGDGAGPHPFEVEIVVRFERNRLVLTDGWTLRGRVRHALSVPSAIQFGGAERLIDKSSFPSKSVRVLAYRPLQQLRAECDESRASVTVLRDQAQPLAFLVAVTPNDALEPGPFAFAVRLTAILPGRQVLPSIPLHVRGTVESDIYAVPAILRFTQTQGQTKGYRVAESVTVQSHSGRPFVVESVVVPPTIAPVAPIDRGAATQHHFSISPAALAPGNGSYVITFHLRTARGDAQLLQLPLRTYGQAAAPGAQPHAPPSIRLPGH